MGNCYLGQMKDECFVFQYNFGARVFLFMHAFSPGQFLLISRDSEKFDFFFSRLLSIYSRKIEYHDLCLDHSSNIIEFPV